MNIRTTLIMLALAVAGLLSWFALSTGDPPAAPEAVAAKATQAVVPKRAPARSQRADAPEPAGSQIHGQVVAVQGGAPIVGAVITLQAHASSDDVPRSTTADAQGRWRLSDVQAGSYAVSATAPDYLPTVVRKTTLPAAGKPSLVLRMDRGGQRLFGVVRDVTGGTVDGALVHATPLSGLKTRHLDGFGTLGRADGTFALQLKAGRYQVDVSHPDYAIQTRTLEVGPGTRAQDFALSPTGAIDGVVLSDASGAPVPNAWVSYAGERERNFGPGESMMEKVSPGTVRTDAEGRFRITGLGSGIINISARGKAVASRQSLSVPLSIAEHISDVELRVAQAFTLSGRVVSQTDTSKGIAHAQIRLKSNGETPISTSDAQGSFTVHGVLPGQYRVVAEADGFLAQYSGQSLEVNADRDDLVVELGPGITLRGRVEPPQVAEISLELRANSHPRGGLLRTLSTTKQVESNKDGTFEIGPVPPGALALAARTADGQTGRTDLADERDGEQEVVIALEPRAKVAGRVLSSAGKPVAEALVSFSAVATGAKSVSVIVNGRQMGAAVGSTAEDGGYLLTGLEQGTYKVNITDRWGDALAVQSGLTLLGNKATFVIEGSGTRSGVDITVDAHDAMLAGRVRTAQGDPAADVWVSASAVDRRLGLPESADHGSADSESGGMLMVLETQGSAQRERPPVLTDAEGKFEITGLREGKYLVVAQRAGGTARTRKEAKTGTQVKLKLAPLGILEGKVTMDGAPASNYTVSVQGPTPRSKNVGSGGAGFTIERLDPGTYNVSVQTPEGSGKAKVKIEPGSTATTHIVLEHLIAVVGRVLAKDGSPIVGAEVILGEGQDGEISITADIDVDAIVTDAEGRFETKCAAGNRALVVIEQGKPGPVAVEFFVAQPGQQKVDLGDIAARDLRAAMQEQGLQDVELDAEG